MSLLLRLASRTASYLGSNKLVIGLVSGKNKTRNHGFSMVFPVHIVVSHIPFIQFWESAMEC